MPCGSCNKSFELRETTALYHTQTQCPTAISSLDEGECESGVSGDPGLGQRITQTLHTCALRNLGDELCSVNLRSAHVCIIMRMRIAY